VAGEQQHAAAFGAQPPEVLGALEIRPAAQAAIGGEPGQQQLADAHAERPEMTPREPPALGFVERREAQPQIDAHDAAPARHQGVKRLAQPGAEAAQQRHRQQREQPQQAEQQPAQPEARMREVHRRGRRDRLRGRRRGSHGAQCSRPDFAAGCPQAHRRGRMNVAVGACGRHAWLHARALHPAALPRPALRLLRLTLRARRQPEYLRRVGERFGYVRKPARDIAVWVHAVSVGETLAAAPFIESLIRRYGEGRVWVSSTTPTGSARLRGAFGQRVAHSYAPYDLPDAVARFLRRVRPRRVVVMETEIWPNLYAALARRRIPLLIANARMSRRSFARWMRWRSIAGQVLAQVRLVAAQSKRDARRFHRLGAPRVRLMGNLKYDITPDAELIARGQQLRHRLGDARPVWLAASTHAGEEEQALAAHDAVLAVHPAACLIIVPRHPQRFAEVAQLIDRSGLRWKRRSVLDLGGGERLAEAPEVLLGDSMGEMFLYLAAADLAFVGGSLVEVGGHNILEPAALGRPVLFGRTWATSRRRAACSCAAAPHARSAMALHWRAKSPACSATPTHAGRWRRPVSAPWPATAAPCNGCCAHSTRSAKSATGCNPPPIPPDPEAVPAENRVRHDFWRPSMEFLITGGSGFIGQALCPRLLEAGHGVTVLSRNPASAAPRLPAAVRLVDSLAALDAVDTVVNLAGASLAEGRWSEARKRLLRDSRILTTRRLLDWMRRLERPPATLISGSAIGYYGDRDDQTLDEDSPPADDFAARLCRDWESAAEAAQGLGVRVCRLRIGVVLDAGGGALAKMLPAFRLGLGGPIGSGRQWMSWIHRRDLVELILWLSDASRGDGAWNGTAPTPVRNADFARSLAHALHRPAWLPAPGALLRLGLGEMAGLLLGGQRVLPRRALDAGFSFRYPDLDSALAAITAKS
jgi:conserved hypothetical protein TIGR01777